MAGKINVPEIRFAGFTDPWEQRKLGDVATITRGERFTAADYVKSDGIPCIHYGEIYTDYGTVATKTISQVKPSLRSSLRYAKPGDVIVATTSENVEDVCKAVAWIGNSPVAYHDDSFALTFSGDPVFLVSFFETSGFYAQKSSVAHGVKVMRVSSDSLANINLPTPLVVEQRLIGSYFSRLDFLITLHQRKYDKLCTVKKSMLDKMFPKPGETEPEIRFEGFTDPWEQRKLGDCFEFLKNNTLSRADLNGENGTARNVHYGDILIKFGDCLDGERSDLPFITDDTVLPKFAGSILREGDVIFAGTAEDEAAGKCVELRKLPKEPTISGLHTIPARPRFPFGMGYLGHYLNSDAYHRQLLPLMQGIKVISVSKAALQDTQVRFPGLSEQTAIGAALSEIDALITLHQRKLELLRNIKKSLLNRMFV